MRKMTKSGDQTYECIEKANYGNGKDGTVTLLCVTARHIGSKSIGVGLVIKIISLAG